MKKKIKPRLDYNIIIMRDDHKMRTFRLKRSTLKFLKLLGLLLLGISIAGCIAAYHYHERFRAMQARHSGQRQELIALKMQLEQFSNLKTLASNAGSPMSTLLNEELEGLTPEVEDTAPPSESQSNSLTDASNNSLNLQTVSTDPAPPPGDEAEPSPLQQEASDALSLPRIDCDASNLRINHFNARATDGGRIILNYTINTVEPNKTVGTVSNAFITSNGYLVELTPRSGNSIKFIINHGRTLESSFTLADGMTPQDISKVLVIIVLEDGTKLVEPFDITL